MWQPAIGRWVCVVWMGIGATTVGARDLWLEPDSLVASRGDEISIHLRTGEQLAAKEEKPLQKERIARFDLFGNEAVRRDLLALGAESQTPAARVRLESGVALVVMDRRPRAVTMEAAKFNAYLAEEGLDAIAAQRARLFQTDQPAREIYSRFLKVLIQERDPAAARANTLYKRRVGKRLEILLENDPGQIGVNGRLAVKVMFDDKPLAGAKIYACRRAKADGQKPVVLTAITSVRGLAEFRLDQPGLWLVRMVHMRAAGSSSRPDPNAPQWESFWATYTFAARFVPTNMPPASPPVAMP